MSRKKCPINENTLGGRLRHFRESKGFTITQFANLTGISHGSLSEIENNKTKPSARPIEALIHKTDINIYWLFTGEGEPYTGKKGIKGLKSRTASDHGGGFLGYGSIEDLVGMMKKILESETEYSASMASNIRCYFKALNNESDLEKRIAELERRQGAKEGAEKVEEDPPQES